MKTAASFKKISMTQPDAGHSVQTPFHTFASPSLPILLIVC